MRACEFATVPRKLRTIRTVLILTEAAVVARETLHRWDKRRTIAVTAIAVHRTIARSIVTRLRYRWLYFRYTR